MSKIKECCCQKEQQMDTIETAHGVFTTIVPDSYKNRKKWERPDPKRLLAYIPGTITEVAVTVGQSVKKGDKLLMFNAMKMANTLSAPFDGEIKSVPVKVGDAVPNGALLVEFA